MRAILLNAARLMVLLAAALPAVWVLSRPIGGAEPTVQEQIGFEPGQIRVDPNAIVETTPPLAEAPDNWLRLAYNQTLELRKMYDKRTFMGDRPQDQVVSIRDRYKMIQERGKYRPQVLGEDFQTTRTLPKPTRRFRANGPFARLINDVLRAKPKTVFVRGYIDQSGRYIGSSFYRGAGNYTTGAQYHTMWATTAIADSSNFYFFSTNSRVGNRSFINGYFARDPIFAPSFYRSQLTGGVIGTGRGGRRSPLAEYQFLRAEYGERRHRKGYRAQMMPITLHTLPPAIMKTIPGVAYFKNRGWGTYHREYYRPPVPRIYRDVNRRLQTKPVVHFSAFTAP